MQNPTYQELFERVAELGLALQNADRIIRQLEEENAQLRMQLRGSSLDTMTNRILGR